MSKPAKINLGILSTLNLNVSIYIVLRYPNEIYIKKGSSGEISPAIIKLAKK